MAVYGRKQKIQDVICQHESISVTIDVNLRRNQTLAGAADDHPSTFVCDRIAAGREHFAIQKSLLQSLCNSEITVTITPFSF